MFPLCFGSFEQVENQEDTALTVSLTDLKPLVTTD